MYLTEKATEAALELETEEMMHMVESYIYKIEIRVHIWVTRFLKNLKDQGICQGIHIIQLKKLYTEIKHYDMTLPDGVLA